MGLVILFFRDDLMDSRLRQTRHQLEKAMLDRESFQTALDNREKELQRVNAELQKAEAQKRILEQERAALQGQSAEAKQRVQVLENDLKETRAVLAEEDRRLVLRQALDDLKHRGPPKSTDLKEFMSTLQVGDYRLIIASYETEQVARSEVERIRSQYPELRPQTAPSLDGKHWAVDIRRVSFV